MAYKAIGRRLATSSTALAILLLAKAVFAFSIAAGATDPTNDNHFYMGIYFFSSIGIVISMVIVYFLRGRKGLGFVLASIFAGVVLAPLTVAYGLVWEDCGHHGLEWMRFDFLIFLALFAGQMIAWVVQVKRARLN